MFFILQDAVFESSHFLHRKNTNTSGGIEFFALPIESASLLDCLLVLRLFRMIDVTGPPGALAFDRDQRSH